MDGDFVLKLVKSRNRGGIKDRNGNKKKRVKKREVGT
jgi:hypothetical protein